LADGQLFEADVNVMLLAFAVYGTRTISLTEKDTIRRATPVITPADRLADFPNLLAQYGARLRFSKFDASRTINATNYPTAGQSYR
jgi:hypothetical protein